MPMLSFECKKGKAMEYRMRCKVGYVEKIILKWYFFSNSHIFYMLAIYLPSTTDYNHCIEQKVCNKKETIIDAKNYSML